MWDQITAWVLSMAWPVVKRIMSALGIGFVTYEALIDLYDQVKESVVTLWGSVGGDILAMATMLGLIEASGIILGALFARLTLYVTGKMFHISV